MPPGLELRSLKRTRSTQKLLRWLFAAGVFFPLFAFSAVFTFDGSGNLTEAHRVLLDMPIAMSTSLTIGAGSWISCFWLRRRLRAV